MGHITTLTVIFYQSIVSAGNSSLNIRNFGCMVSIDIIVLTSMSGRKQANMNNCHNYL